MALSEIRVNTTKTRTGVGTITYTETGPVITGIATADKFSGEFEGAATITSGNITATTGTFSGNVSIGGTLTYEDVTNIDSVGIITARDGLKVLAGGANVVGVVTATSFVGGLPISNGANNRVITASSATALQGESGLTFSGSNLKIEADSPQLQITESDTSTSSRLVMSGGKLYIQIAQQGQGSSTSPGIMYLTGYNNTTASEIHLKANNTYNTGNFHLSGHLEPGANTTYTCGTSSKRWSVVNTNVLSAASYAAVGSIVAADPGSNYYSYNNRIGSGLAIVGTTRMFGSVGIGSAAPVGNLDIRDTKANLIVAKDGLPVKSNSDLAASYDIIQLGAGGALASYSATSVTADTMFIHNAYRHSGNNWKRRYADTAARMRVNSPANTWIFETAATGSADSDITSWAESLRINSGGTLLVHKTTTSDYGKFEVKGGTADDIETSDITAKTIATFSGSTPGTTAAGKGAGIVIKPIADRGCNYFIGVANDSSNQEAHGRFIIRSGNFAGTTTERLRIDSSGNLHLRSAATCRLVLGSSGGSLGALSNNENWIRGSGTMVQLNTAGGDYGFEVLGDQKMKLDTSGNLELRSATQNRITFGSAGSSGNDTNWVRGDGNDLMFNCITNHKWEVAGSEKVRIDSHGCVRVGNTATQTTSGNTKRIALGGKGSIWGWVSSQINGAITLADNYYWDGANNRAIEADHAAYLALRLGTLRFGTTDSTPSAGGVTGLTEKFRIKVGGEVHMGVSSPTTSDVSADDLVIGNTSGGVNRGLTIWSNSSQNGSIAFADNNSNFRGAVQYLHGDDQMRFLATGEEKFRITEHGTFNTPITGGDSVNTKQAGRFYTISGATPLDGTYNSDTETPIMRCGHSFNGTMRLWMAFGGDEFHNGCRQMTVDCQGTYGYTDFEDESFFHSNALGAGLNSLVFSYQNSGSPNYYFKVRGTWASGQNQPIILWSWTGHNSEYPYAL